MYKEGYFNNSTVYIIDYIPDTLNNISSLVNSIGYNYHLFKTIDEFLQAYANNRLGCILINLHHSNIDISSMASYLVKHGCLLPIVGVSEKVNIQNIINAARQGVVDFLIKPIKKKILEQSINKSFTIAQEIYKNSIEYRNTIRNFNSLTSREKQIFNLITEGLSNKIIASKLLISIRTVEMHRYHIMKKMQANSVVALIKQSMLLSKKFKL
jgi:FixJ family two-component response regulator